MKGPHGPHPAADYMSSPVSFIHRIWSAYCSCLHRRPLATKTTTGAVIFFTSDSLTQVLTGNVSGWKASRALSGAGFGIVATTWLHFWWGALEAMVERRIPRATHRLSNTLVKVVVDQALAAPLYIYSYFVVTNMGQQLMQDKHSVGRMRQLFQDTNAKASAMLMPTMMQHWTLWPIVHSFNFYYMPLHHRVLVQNTVLVGWSGYLSHLNHQAATLMTPTEEAHVAIQRRETRRRQSLEREKD
jgi:protein Mpv17